ncbi:hypothetical protein [Paracoccus beibuensis]|uniref:hypothetical protein n=1 Tax=Paracoccus beibuensis TaxID=547602 RepID=UPI002240A291|nr:hypothetical protein [Paracoccus beibuensis]
MAAVLTPAAVEAAMLLAWYIAISAVPLSLLAEWYLSMQRRRAWEHSAPDPEAVRRTWAHIRAEVEWLFSRPSVTADPVPDLDQEKRISWGRAR